MNTELPVKSTRRLRYDQLERLNEAQTLESLIRQTTTIINKINSEYTTYEEKSVGTGSDKKIICEKKLNLFDISVLGLFQFSNDSFTTKERAHIISYVKTLRKYLQDMLRVKFLMRSIKEVLPDLRKGDKNAAASRLRQIFQNKSTKAEWITSATYPGYWGPGFQKPAGEFRDKLDEVNLKKLEFEFESVSKCLLKSP